MASPPPLIPRSRQRWQLQLLFTAPPAAPLQISIFAEVACRKMGFIEAPDLQKVR